MLRNFEGETRDIGGEIVLGSMLTYFVVEFERHPSVDAQRASLYSKMLLVAFINTGAVMFMVSANSISASPELQISAPAPPKHPG